VYNARAERERVQRDNNPDRILQLAARPDGFSVSLRYRDDALRRLCTRMVKKGLLRHPRRLGGHLVFYPKDQQS
jgi:hypothetical protein